jgi:hypothetical protein
MASNARFAATLHGLWIEDAKEAWPDLRAMQRFEQDSTIRSGSTTDIVPHIEKARPSLTLGE